MYGMSGCHCLAMTIRLEAGLLQCQQGRTHSFGGIFAFLLVAIICIVGSTVQGDRRTVQSLIHGRKRMKFKRF